MKEYSRKEIQDLVELAYTIACEAHAGQFRKDGKPYITHVEAVAKIISEDYFRLIPQSAECRLIWGPLKPFVVMGALLHDTIEDTYVTAEYLREKGFPPLVIDMVLDVTKLEGEGYFDFIMRTQESGNVGSKCIKLGDLTHNTSDLKEGAQKAKYQLAYYILDHFNH